MPKPNTATTTSTSGGKRGKKNDPHLSTTAGQSKEGEGRGSQSDSTPEHTENIPAQKKTDNANSDRMGSETREDHQSQEKRNPLGHDSEGVSEETGPSPGVHFKPDAWRSQVLAVEHDDVLSSTILVLLTLGALFDDNGECWPSQALLAKMTKLTVKTVKDHTDIAERIGLLDIDRKGSKNGRRAIIYKARMPMS